MTPLGPIVTDDDSPLVGSPPTSRSATTYQVEKPSLTCTRAFVRSTPTRPRKSRPTRSACSLVGRSAGRGGGSTGRHTAAQAMPGGHGFWGQGGDATATPLAPPLAACSL